MGAVLAYSDHKSSTSNSRPGNCIQPKLKVVSANDPQEVQADKVAEHVMRMPSNSVGTMAGLGHSKPVMSIAKKCSHCEKDEQLSRKEERLEDIDQPKMLFAKPGTAFSGGGAAPSAVSSGISATKGSGSGLSGAVNSDLGSKMNADFSGVKIHDNEHSAKMNAQINARAFTVGNDIYFNKGEYNPHSQSGKFLLAHELTHTIQQGGSLQRKPEEGPINRKEQKEEKIQRGIGEWLADQAWDILESEAPGFVQVLREISNKGILGFLKDKLMEGLNHIFDKFPSVGNFVTNLMAVFSMLYQRVAVIMDALASGDCAPLLSAVQELKEIVSTIATDAWNDLTEFVQPIGDFFSGLWSSFGAPVVDWLGETAADIWTWLQSVGERIWNWTEPIREYGATAWDWVKSTLGIGSDSAGAENENGIIQWIMAKAEEAWVAIKEVMRPVIEPVQRIASKVLEILPLDAIMNLRDTISNFAQNVGSMATAMGDEGAGVAAQQASLRDTILPAVQQTILDTRNDLINTGLWISDKVGGFVAMINEFYNSVAASPIFSVAAFAISWINDVANNLGSWIQDGVIGLFNGISNGLAYLASFIDPVLSALQRIVNFLSDLVGNAADFILGPFMLIPECIRTPIKTFLIEQILGRIPLFNQIMALGDVWTRAQQVAMTILYQVFVDGDLGGALWTFFRALLNIVGIPPELVVSILANASSAIVDILANPLDFFINLLSGLKQGFVQFFDNIGSHLLAGVGNWLTSQMEGLGITPPADFSFASIFGFVMQILGITVDHIFELLATRLGEERAAQLRGALDMASGAFSFIADVVQRGPEAIWERLQDQLSNLWESVIGNIVTFINEQIIARATRWVLAMLDITGIMPVVNSVIAVYNAIESFAEYIVPILNIINQYVTMLADIAKGSIAGAANYVENLLSESLPIMIGFLANQFGFSNLASRMQEILATVKERIDAGILWVIDQAMAIGGAIMQAGRNVVAAVRDWWHARVDFRAEDGRNHSLYLEGSEANPILMVASERMTFVEFINGITEHSNKAAARAKAQEIDTLKRTKTDASGRVLTEEEMPTAITNLLIQLRDLVSPMLGGSAMQSEDPHYMPGNQTTGGFSNGTTVTRLTHMVPHSGNGSRPTGNNNGTAYDILNNRRMGEKGASYYIKGHLLNQELFGKGQWENMVPLSRSGNGQMEAQVENRMRRATEGGDSLDVKVTPIYGNKGNKTALKKDIDKNEPDPIKSKLKQDIVDAEQFVPTEIVVKATSLNHDSNFNFADPPIENLITQSPDDYQLGPTPLPPSSNLSLSNPVDLAASGLSAIAISEILKLRAQFAKNGRERFATWDEVRKAVDSEHWNIIDAKRKIGVLTLFSKFL